ncbi:hypothetical protein [Novosphingobium jiangmenense]|uniref:Uncharacterized protein n=1 Tax=Novosphingobium jiangmenense TaxID=2791981 RepID=A0ABS0HKL5_9SPHN|nr:hypothetical protein [Novosphingobium jiangmenense]MBF9152529.1 hypothetical protein [Novosphingobium jiangmenense]
MLSRNANSAVLDLGWLRPVGWGAAAFLLLLPMVGMLFEDRLHWGVNWTAGDFLAAAVLLGGTGAALEVAVRLSGNLAYRAGAFLGIGAALVLVWANLAVGLVGSEGDAANLWFMAVPVVGLVMAAVGRFSPQGLVRAMLAMVVAQIVAGVAAGGTVEAVAITLVWSAVWLACAWLFRRAC